MGEACVSTSRGLSSQKGVAEQTFSAPAGRGSTGETLCRPRRSGSATTFGHYAGIRADVNSFMSELCQAGFRRDFEREKAAPFGSGPLVGRAVCFPERLPDDRADDVTAGRVALGLERDEKAEVGERRLRLDLGLVTLAGVHHLAELDVLVVGRDGPEHVDLTGRRLLQLVEARDNHGGAVLARLDVEVDARARQSARELDVDLGVVA